ERALARENGACSRLGIELRNGMICWAWNRDDINPADVVGSGQFWTLRLPLSTDRSGWGYINLYRDFESKALMLDINYLCQLFRREMAAAAERVLGAARQEEAVTELAMAASTGD
ncbi:MAG TPA: hypothetical protein VJT09_02035, partial [Pyrinomonadaceae bacterium]|nr:hypothetical protein [Pyrinomonadaceae bacterium]